LHGATGGGCDETEVREWLQRISTDPSGEIDIYDLAQIIVTSEGPAYHRTAKAKAKELERGFNLVAVSGGGALSAEGLQMAAARLNAKWSMLEATEVLHACDVDANGVVDLKDFVKLMQDAWEQPQEHWEDLEMEEKARLAVRQAEIDRMVASLKELTHREEDDPKPIDEEAVEQLKAVLDPLQRLAETEYLNKALKHMPDGANRIESEARLEEIKRIEIELIAAAEAAAAEEAAAE